MSLKNIKTYFLTPPSIIRTLTLLFTTTTFILLGISSLFAYQQMNQLLNEKNSQFVSDEVNIIYKIILSNPKNDNAFIQEVEEVPKHLLHDSVYEYFVRVIDLDNKKTIETKGMETIFKDTPIFNENYLVNKNQNWTSQDKKNYLLMTKYIINNNKHWVIQVALDTSYDNQKLSLFLYKLIIVLCLGTLIAFLFGTIISKNGMRKVNELTETAKNVTLTSLDKRIDPKIWPVELKDLGLAFNDMLDRIEDSFLRLSQFSSDIAHELRTPVNNLLGEIEITLSHTPSQGEYKQVLESNIEEVRRLSQIIENLLFLAKTENPKFDVVKTKLNLKNEILIVCQFYESMAEDLNIQIHLSGDGEFYGNSLMIRRMMSNILSNALKYSAPNKNIRIEIKETSQETIQIKIQDEGFGIAKEHLPKIFDRFYRVDPSRSQNSGGTGLGLAIVKSLVELHHGTISIASDVGKGTLFEINFPNMTKL